MHVREDSTHAVRFGSRVPRPVPATQPGPVRVVRACAVRLRVRVRVCGGREVERVMMVKKRR
jgi:hypothetical protein